MTINYILKKLALDPKTVKITVNNKEITQINYIRTFEQLGISNIYLIKIELQSYKSVAFQQKASGCWDSNICDRITTNENELRKK
jgi:hypothetical protein